MRATRLVLLRFLLILALGAVAVIAAVVCLAGAVGSPPPATPAGDSASSGLWYPLHPGWDPVCYRTYEQTQSLLQSIAVAYPDLATLSSEGYSWENTRQLWLMRLSSNRNPSPGPTLYIVAGQHPRDIATSAVVISYTLYLVQNYGLDPDVTWLLDNRTVALMPVANPDGYYQVYAGGYAYWYKNTDNDDGCTNSGSWGTDINRNYPFHWNEGGASANPCDSSYRGPGPLSEAESQHILASVQTLGTDLLLNLQAPGPAILYPWGWSSSPPPDLPGLDALGWHFALLNGTPRQAVRTHNASALISGILDDAAYGLYNIPAFTFNIGSAIAPTCSTLEQIWQAQRPALTYAARVVGGTPSITLSRPFGPVVSGLAVDPQPPSSIRVTGVVSASYGTVASAVYTIDTPGDDGSGTPMQGDFGGGVASVSATIDTGNLQDGRHILLVQGQNDAGYWGVYSSIFFTVTGGTATPGPSATLTPRITPVASASATPTATSTATATPVATATPAITATATTATTATSTSTPTPTPTRTPRLETPTLTPTRTATSTATMPATPTRMLTRTPTPAPPPDTPTPLPCANYSDVRPGQYFYEAVQWLTCRHIISGYADGTFRPGNPATRAQLVKMVVLGEGWPLQNPPTASFTDVPPSGWHYAYIETAFAHGIIGGYSDGTFRPDNPVTRGQLSKIIVGARQWPLLNPEQGHFSDVPPGSAFYTYVETAFGHAIISGYADGTFRPGNPATRGQLSKMLYSALTLP